MARTSKPVVVVLALNPVPASRVRVTRWGSYYTKPYADWMKAAEATTPPSPGVPAAGHYTCDLQVIVLKPRTSKLTRPKGDVDNYAKAALDVLTKLGYWPDDADITDLTVIKRFAAADEEPCTMVKITGPLP